MSLLLPRRRTRSSAALLALGFLAATTSVGHAQAEPPRPEGRTTIAPARLLDEPLGGREAVRELGDQLGVAAVRNGLDAGELRTLLRDDRTVRVDDDGLVHFVEPAAESDAGAAGAAVAPLADTFLLHSNPGSSLKIFLDVDGSDVSGTSWNSSYGVIPGTHPAWDPAHDGPAFSDAERVAVQEVWAIVAEDYAPFGVDVTTQDPGPTGLVRSSSADTSYGTRVLVTPSADPWAKICQSRCGGVAYLRVFDRTGSATQPAWVFPQALHDDPKAVGEAAAHEAGHNLGLDHDGTTSSSYYGGQGSWAPIMGVGYNRPISQWSHGSYPGADNGDQDDVAVIATYLGLRGDEAQGPTGVPAALPSGPVVISSASDVDTYLLGSCPAGTVLAVDPAAYAPNLDVQVTVRDSSGTVVATAAPASGFGDGTTATGLGARITLPATDPGSTVSVDGVGEGTWAANGYDDYGSLGSYTISAPGCSGTPSVLPPPTSSPTPSPTASPTPTPTATPTTTAPPAVTAAPGRLAVPRARVRGHKVVLRWTAATSPVSAYLVDGSRGSDQSVGGSTRKLVLRLAPGRYGFRVAALNAGGQSPFSGWVKIRVR